MDITVRLADNILGTKLLELAGDFQTALEIIADADKTDVEVSYTEAL